MWNGEPSTSAFVVETGRVCIRAMNDSGGEHIVGWAAPAKSVRLRRHYPAEGCSGTLWPIANAWQCTGIENGWSVRPQAICMAKDHD